jgi:hypothetical protein
MAVKRFDQCTMDGAPEKTPEGFVRFRAFISRTGVQIYRQPDGTERREYRPPEEVFSRDALSSFSLKPLTLYHPEEPVTPENYSRYAMGVVGQDLSPHGKYVATVVVAQHRDAIEAIARGVRELSCGYTCDLEEKPGESPEGLRYDAVQRNIRGNHVALVPVGRAGPEVSLRMDAGDAVQVDRPEHGGSDVKKIKVDGKEFDVSQEVYDALFASKRIDAEGVVLKTTEQTATGGRCDTMENGKKCDAMLQCPTHGSSKSDCDRIIAEARARADVAEQNLEKEKKARKDAEDPKRIVELAKKRSVLERSAAAILGANEKLDELSDLEIKKKVLGKAQPEIKLDGQSDAYIDAAFDVVVKTSEKKPNSETYRLRVPEAPEGKEGEKKDEREDSEDPQERFKARARKQHKEAATRK